MRLKKEKKERVWGGKQEEVAGDRQQKQIAGLYQMTFNVG